MNDDELRAEVASADPVARSQNPVEGRRRAELLERIMATDTNPITDVPRSRFPGRRPLVAWGAIGAAAVIAAGALTWSLQSGQKPVKAPTQIALSLPSGTSLPSCIPFSVDNLKTMSPAFAGTVNSTTGGKLTLRVDHWYAGGSADEVVLDQPDAGTPVSVGSVTFEEGKRYLVTAANGVVNGCGYTGLATPDLQRSFDAAFPG